jgi:hypothetical protein
MTEAELHHDPALLGLARRALAARGFRVSEGQLPGLGDTPWLLAESDLFVLAVVAGQGLQDLQILESYAAPVLSERLAEADLGAKRWDAYLILLASGGSDERGAREVLDLQYNTRALRRIVALGVAADEGAVLSALSTFMPLPDPPSGGLTAAFDDLIEQLVVNGIDRDRAQAAVTAYREPRSGDGT